MAADSLIIIRSDSGKGLFASITGWPSSSSTGLPSWSSCDSSTSSTPHAYRRGRAATSDVTIMSASDLLSASTSGFGGTRRPGRCTRTLRELMNAFGGELRTARLEREWSRQKVAEESGLTVEDIEALENGHSDGRAELPAALQLDEGICSLPRWLPRSWTLQSR